MICTCREQLTPVEFGTVNVRIFFTTHRYIPSMAKTCREYIVLEKRRTNLAWFPNKVSGPQEYTSLLAWIKEIGAKTTNDNIIQSTKITSLPFTVVTLRKTWTRDTERAKYRSTQRQ